MVAALYRFADFELDLDRFELRYQGEPRPLDPKVFDLGRYLIENRDRVVGKEEILEALWPDSTVSEASLTRAVYLLRKALGDGPGEFRIVRTVHRRGYQFVAPVSVATREQSAGESEGRAIPGPVRTGELPPSGAHFVGREHELRELRSNLAAAVAGRGRLVLISGDAGIGKTRTAREFAAHASRAGARVRFASCLEVEGAPPFWPWVQMLRSDVEELGRDVVFAALGSAAALVTDWVPELGWGERQATRPRDESWGDVRFLLFDGIARYLKRLSGRGPSVLFFDDLHRADPSTLHLLRFIAMGAHELPLMLLGTYRDADFEMDPDSREILTAALRESGGQVIRLTGLDQADVARLVESTTGRAPVGRAIERFWLWTRGNPFFLSQLLSVPGSDWIEESESLPGRLADGIRATLDRQLSRLPEALGEVLTIGAVVGKHFEAELVGEVSGLGIGTVTGLLEQAASARIVERADSGPHAYSFAHLLLRDAVYQQLPAPMRADLHRRVGEALERVGEAELEVHLATLAHHFWAASLGAPDERAARYAMLAGDAAAGRQAYEEAGRYYERALHAGRRLLAEPAQYDLLLKLGTVLGRAGFRAQAQGICQRAADLAERMGSPERRARAVLAISPGLYAMEVGVFDARFVGLLQEAIEALGKDHLHLRARLMARLALALYCSNRDEQRVRLGREALVLAEQSGDPSVLAYALSAQHVGLIGQPDLEEQIRLARSIVEVADPSTDRETSLMYRMLLITHLLERGAIAELDRELLAFDQAAQELRQPQSLWQTVAFRGMRALLSGHFSEAARAAQEFAGIGRRIQDANAVQMFGAHMCLIRLECGPLDEAQAMLEAHVVQYSTVRAWRSGLALCYARQGQSKDARREFEFLAADDFHTVPRDLLWLFTLGFLSEVCVHLRDRPRAERLLSLLAPYADRCSVLGYGLACLGSLARPLGGLAALLGRDAEAADYYEHALALDSRIGARPFVVRTQLAYAELLRARGDTANAKQMAKSARAEARELGMIELPPCHVSA